MASTFSALIAKVITRISQVPGTGVQTYAEDRIGDMIQDAFNAIFDDEWWSQFLFYNSYTLDGSTGVVTTDLSSVLKGDFPYDDIYAVFYESDEHALAELPLNFNRETIQGTKARFIVPHETQSATKIFQVYPKTATGTVHVIGRTRPDAFSSGDTVSFDDTALILAATADYLEDDAANPGSVDKFNKKFESRLHQLKRNRNNKPLPLDPRLASRTDVWREV
jgi:hypothetical protein